MGIRALVWRLDFLISLLFALINLYSYAGRGFDGWRCRYLSMVDNPRRSWDRQPSIQATRQRRWYVILLGIERITQSELNVSLVTGESKALSIIGIDQKGDHRSIL